MTQSKRGTVHARRLVGRWLLNRDLISKLFDEIAPRFSTRPGGYLRIVKLGSRQGDGAEMAVLEFVDFQMKKKEVAPPADAKGKKAKDEEGEGDEAEKAAKPKQAKTAKAPVDKKKASGPRAKTTKSPVVAKKSSAPKKVGGG